MLMYKRKVALLTFFILATGCSSKKLQQEKIDKIAIPISTKTTFGTAVRWNEDYIVTTKHTEGLISCDSSKYDVAFIKDKLEGKKINFAKWTNFKSKEKIVMSGFIKNQTEYKKIPANITQGSFDYMGHFGYKLVDKPSVRGMSGGPVINKNGEVIGIIIGHTNDINLRSDPENTPPKKYGVILPYQHIYESWEEVKVKLKNGDC